MVIHRPSDSMSRCDPGLYESLYDVRRNPDIKEKDSVKLTRPNNKDTIEISRDVLTEEALSRLRHTSKYVIAQNSFMRIGNYLFLAIALPPYLLLYGLPKWILVEGIPGLFSMTVRAWNKAGKLAKPYGRGAMRQLLELVQALQRVSQALLRPFVFLSSKIRQSLQRVREGIFRPIKKTFDKIFDKMQERISAPFSKIAEAFKNLQNPLPKISENISRRLENIAQTIQENVQRLKEIPQTFLGWGQLQFLRISQQTSSWGVQWKNQWKSSQSFAQKGADWVYKKIHNRIEGMKRVFAPIRNFYKNGCLPLLHTLRREVKRKWDETMENFHRRQQRFLAKLQKKQEKLGKLSSKNFLHYLITRPSLEKLPRFIGNWVKGFLSHSLTRLICDGILKVCAFSARIFLQGIVYFTQALSQGLSFARKFSNWIQDKGIAAGGHLLRGFKGALKGVEKAIFYLLYHFLLFLTMLIILLAWSMRSLGVRTTKLFALLRN